MTYLNYKEDIDIPVFGIPHTCRNFSKVHEWAWKRRSVRRVDMGIH